MKTIFISTICALLFFSCSESYNDANFRCKINGEEFVPSKDFIHARYVPYSSNVSTVTLSGHKIAKFIPAGLDGKMELYDIDMHPDSVAKTIKFKKTSTFYYKNDKSEKIYRTDLNQPNGIIFETYEPTKGGVVKGTFFLTAKEENGAEVLQITDGFFDLKFE